MNDVITEIKSEVSNIKAQVAAPDQAMKYEPLFDRVLVRPSVVDDKSKGGIIIPDNAKEKSQSGTVLATGPGIATRDGFVAVPVKPGDHILYGKFSGFEVGIDVVKEIAGGELVSEVETLIVLRAQEIVVKLREGFTP